MGDESNCKVYLTGDPHAKIFEAWQVGKNPECEIVHFGDGVVAEAKEGVVGFFQAAWNKLSSIIQGKGNE